jgi:hypothetical protein
MTATIKIGTRKPFTRKFFSTANMEAWCKMMAQLTGQAVNYQW